MLQGDVGRADGHPDQRLADAEVLALMSVILGVALAQGLPRWQVVTLAGGGPGLSRRWRFGSPRTFARSSAAWAAAFVRLGLVALGHRWTP